MAITLNKRRTDLRREVLPGPVGFIGAGKVGTALASLLHARGVDVVAVSGHKLDDSRRMALSAKLPASAAKERAQTVASASIVFLAVPDDKIEKVSNVGSVMDILHDVGLGLFLT